MQRSEFIKIEAVATDGNSTVYRVRRTSELGKLMQYVANHLERRVETLRFHYHGKRICATDTPDSLNMGQYHDDEDVAEANGEITEVIEVWWEVFGGGANGI